MDAEVDKDQLNPPVRRLTTSCVRVSVERSVAGPACTVENLQACVVIVYQAYCSERSGRGNASMYNTEEYTDSKQMHRPLYTSGRPKCIKKLRSSVIIILVNQRDPISYESAK